jgi:hypothetical protein
MITFFFIQALQTLLSVIMSPLLLLPDAVLPQGVVDAWGNVVEWINPINPLFPVDTLLAVFGIYLSIEVAIFTYKAIMWLVKKIPTIS